MKLFKRFFNLSVIIILFFTFFSCSDCNNEKPRARITNLGVENASVLIKTTSGNTENLNNIEPGKSSEFKSYNSGSITFTVTLKNSATISKTVEMGFCSEYEIIINKDNSITIIPTEVE